MYIKKKVVSKLGIFSFVKIVCGCKDNFYSARGMNRWISIFSEGIMHNAYCYI
jgi:hypothetical protein